MANLLAHPDFTFVLKESIDLELPAMYLAALGCQFDLQLALLKACASVGIDLVVATRAADPPDELLALHVLVADR